MSVAHTIFSKRPCPNTITLETIGRLTFQNVQDAAAGVEQSGPVGENSIIDLGRSPIAAGSPTKRGLGFRV